MPLGVSQSFSFCGAGGEHEGVGLLVSLWRLSGIMEEGVWAKWDEDFSGLSLKGGQHSRRDGLMVPADIVPKAVCGGLGSWLQKVHWCPSRLPSSLPGIDQPCQVKLLLLNASSMRRSEERRELQKDCAILNVDQTHLVQALTSAIQWWCMVLPSGEELKGASLTNSISHTSPLAQGAGELFKMPLLRGNRP